MANAIDRREEPLAPMQLIGPAEQPNVDEFVLLNRHLPLNDARVLELGCGAAEKTRQLAEDGKVAGIVAAEVDQVQHEKNLLIEDLPTVDFRAFGAQSIPMDDESFDIVLMFKSLHHVPVAQMPIALAEIRRVLKPGGLLYVSEPVFDGAFNDIIRLFHDEQAVRLAAFNAMEQAISEGLFTLLEEQHFKNSLRLSSFAQFEAGIINVTHTDHQLSDTQLELIRARFEAHGSEAGYCFDVPHRFDLLQRR